MADVTEIQPDARLAPWVEAYWTRPARAGDAEERVLPDGCADVIFSLDEGTAMVVGAMTRPLLLSGPTPSYFAVRFRPGRAGAFLRMPLHEVTDQRAGFGDAELAGRVAEARTAAARIAAIESWLARRAASSELDRRIERAVDLLAAGRSVDAVAREVNLSRQHLRRRFLRQVGLGPKTFARVARFQRLLGIMRGGAAPSWAGAAADAGYFDQSHLIADFRDLAGTTPRSAASMELGMTPPSF